MTDELLLPSQLLAVSSDVLVSGGYARVTVRGDWDTSSTRLFEDAYSVVGLAVFENCEDLLEQWPDLQASLVEIISQHVERSEPKAWEGYLVLMTSSFAPSRSDVLEELRYNTNRVRKIVATGEGLSSVADIRLALSSLLPLTLVSHESVTNSALDLLPELLTERGIDPDVTRALISAFRDQEPLVDRMHAVRGKKK